ncbi:MAG: N-acyl homoserine lactonase family protein [Acidimicrobiales bacterium]
MKLIPLELGKIEAALRVVTGEDGTVTLPIAGWLIEHPNGLALFDNGMHQGLQTDITRLGRTAKAFRPDYHPGDEVSAQLAARGIRPSDIDVMIFSHLHFDHAGGTGELPDARIVVQQAEWEAGHDAKLIEEGVYDPIDYDHGHDVQAVKGEHDVFGDGTVTCIPTPGHTPGHQALRIELESGPVVLTGDCVYFERMMDDMLVPKFGHDTDQQRQSMQHLASLRDEGCKLIYGHDEAQFRSLPSEGLQ